MEKEITIIRKNIFAFLFAHCRNLYLSWALFKYGGKSNVEKSAKCHSMTRNYTCFDVSINKGNSANSKQTSIGLILLVRIPNFTNGRVSFANCRMHIASSKLLMWLASSNYKDKSVSNFQFWKSAGYELQLQTVVCFCRSWFMYANYCIICASWY